MSLKEKKERKKYEPRSKWGVGYQDLSGSNTKKQLFESSLIDISYKNKSWEEK